MLNKQNDTSNIGGLQIAECQDLAVALQGQDGTFVATTPDGGTLVIDAQEGHSIASLCFLPKAQGQSTFNVVKIGQQQVQQNQQRRQQG